MDLGTGGFSGAEGQQIEHKQGAAADAAAPPSRHRLLRWVLQPITDLIRPEALKPKQGLVEPAEVLLCYFANGLHGP